MTLRPPPCAYDTNTSLSSDGIRVLVVGMGMVAGAAGFGEEELGLGRKPTWSTAGHPEGLQGCWVLTPNLLLAQLVFFLSKIIIIIIP